MACIHRDRPTSPHIGRGSKPRAVIRHVRGLTEQHLARRFPGSDPVAHRGRAVPGRTPATAPHANAPNPASPPRSCRGIHVDRQVDPARVRREYVHTGQPGRLTESVSHREAGLMIRGPRWTSSGQRAIAGGTTVELLEDVPCDTHTELPGALSPTPTSTMACESFGLKSAKPAAGVVL